MLVEKRRMNDEKLTCKICCVVNLSRGFVVVNVVVKLFRESANSLGKILFHEGTA